MSEQTERKCGKCELPISKGETGIRYYGFHVAHAEHRCIQLLHDEITRLRAELSDARMMHDCCKAALTDACADVENLLAELSASKAREDALRADAERLDAIAENHWRLDSFEMPTGGGDADIGWRVSEYYMSEPELREVAAHYADDPRKAIDAARSGGEGGK